MIKRVLRMIVRRKLDNSRVIGEKDYDENVSFDKNVKALKADMTKKYRCDSTQNEGLRVMSYYMITKEMSG